MADYAASARARTTIIGAVNHNNYVLTDPATDDSHDAHWGDMWHYALARLMAANRANELRPIDGPLGIFPIQTAIEPQPDAQLFWGVRGNGQSIPAKRHWPKRL